MVILRLFREHSIFRAMKTQGLENIDVGVSVSLVSKRLIAGIASEHGARLK